jgi:predicted transcriptional regulator
MAADRGKAARVKGIDRNGVRSDELIDLAFRPIRQEIDLQELEAVFTGKAALADPVERHMGGPLPLVGTGESVDAAREALRTADALMVVDDGKPIGVLTRHDLLGFVANS